MGQVEEDWKAALRGNILGSTTRRIMGIGGTAVDCWDIQENGVNEG